MLRRAEPEVGRPLQAEEQKSRWMRADPGQRPVEQAAVVLRLAQAPHLQSRAQIAQRMLAPENRLVALDRGLGSVLV